MKKLIIGLMATALSLTLIPSVKADNVKPAITMTVPGTETSAQTIDVRVRETNHNRKDNNITVRENRESKKELRETAKYSNHRDGVIFIGGGTLLIIIILIIILL